MAIIREGNPGKREGGGGGGGGGCIAMKWPKQRKNAEKRLMGGAKIIIHGKIKQTENKRKEMENEG